MDQALEHWRRSYHVEDNAFESLMGIISTHGSQPIFSNGNGTQPYQWGFPPTRYFTGNDFGDTSEARRAPLIAPPASPFLQPRSDAMTVQDMVTKADPFMGYVSPAQDPVAAPSIDNIVSETVQDSSQSSVVASRGSHSRSCVNCWAAKKIVSVGHRLWLSKISTSLLNEPYCDLGTPCKRCMGPTRTQLPRHLCLRIRLVDEGVFSKCWPSFLNRRAIALIDSLGAEPSYKSKLVWKSLVRGPAGKFALLTHDRGGPTLQVHCYEFDATSQDQTQLFWKESTGWNWMYSTTYSLEVPNIDLRQYIDECASFLLKGASEKADYLGQIFQMAQLYRDVSFSPAADSRYHS